MLLGRSLARRGLLQSTPEVFQLARIHAEQRAYQNIGASCTLEDIHRELSAALRLTTQQTQLFQEEELALEEALIRPVPGGAERVRKARDSGQRVIYLSDMYLPSAWIENQLEQFGLWETGDRCYVSCEWGKDKTSGSLFEAMLANEEVKPGSVLHLGNNADADTRPAKRLGILVEPITSANLNRFETLMDGHARETGGFAAALAGASRMARLCTPARDAKEVGIRDVSAGVTAPVLAGYVLWILQRANQLGIRRLYFLSRDGQVLLAVAERLKKALALSIDLRYLYGSRQAWNLPAILTGSDDELAWMWDTPDLLSVKSLLARVGLTPEQVEEPLVAAGLKPADWSRPLLPAELSRLRESLLNPAVRAAILEQARQKRKIFIAYLKQEGVFEEPTWGLVDLGWYGSMQNSISAVLREEGASLPVGFYFALFQGSVPHLFAQNRETYFFDERAQTGFAKSVPGIIALMEMFTVSDQGTVIEYRSEAGQVQPVLKQARNQPALDWGLPLVRQTIHTFLDQLILDEASVDPFADTREAARDVLQAFWAQPDIREARAWADFPWEDGLGAETYTRPLAEPFHAKDVLLAMRHARVAPHHRSAWMQGSLMLSTAPVRLTLQVLARLLHLYRSWRWRAQVRFRKWRSQP